MRQHLVSNWWVWLLIVVAVVVVNEVVDRNFFDHREHIDGDFALAVVALVIGFLGSYLVAPPKATGNRLGVRRRLVPLGGSLRLTPTASLACSLGDQIADFRLVDIEDDRALPSIVEVDRDPRCALLIDLLASDVADVDRLACHCIPPILSDNNDRGILIVAS